MAAYNFPNSPSDGDTATVNGVTYTYSSSKTRWDGAAASGSSTTVYATIDDLPLSGASTGDQAYVSGNNRLYLWNGTGWYNIALINTTPSISGASASYDLATDGTATTVTITATDPEGIPITYSIASDTSGNIATVSQGTGSNTNVFTITPSTNTAHAGTFSLTFRASDGVNIATAASSFTLVFTVSNSNYTTALITSVGANNAVNNSFDDSSTSNHTITASGNVTQSTFSPYRRGGYSIYGDGSDAVKWLETSANEFTFGTGDFTIEFWIWLDYAAVGATGEHCMVGNNGTDTELWFSVVGSNHVTGSSGAGYLFQIGTGSGWATTVATAAGGANKLRQWVHLAVTCKDVSGTRTINIWENGTSVASGTTTVNIPNTNSQLSFLGRPQTYGQYTTGYMHDIRITKGEAVYTTSFTPPDKPMTAGSNTKLLALRGPTLIDESSNVAIGTIANGDPVSEPFGPYDYSPYSSSSHGASAYFDGNGDYLSIADSEDFNMGTGDYTIEFWYRHVSSTGNYPSAVATQNWSGSEGLALRYDNTTTPNKVAFFWRGTGDPWLTSTNTFPEKTWMHIALVRSGTSFKLYVNGKEEASGTNSSANDWSTGGSFRVGWGTWDGSNGYINANMADLRVVKGTAVYTSAFTPPTAPLTAITNTSLLLPFDDAGIIDKSQSVKSITVYGNTKSSTDYYKYLTSSMYFDGTGDYLSADDNNVGDFGTQDFTAEGWFYLTASPANYIAICETRGSGATTTGWAIAINAAGSFYVYSGAFLCQAPNSSISSNTWYHWAYSRASGNHRLFIDGTQVGSTSTTSRDYTDTNFRIGGNFAGAELFTGYQSDVRITKGYARYTANFTKPSAALQG